MSYVAHTSICKIVFFQCTLFLMYWPYFQKHQIGTNCIWFLFNAIYSLPVNISAHNL